MNIAAIVVANLENPTEVQDWFINNIVTTVHAVTVQNKVFYIVYQ